MLFSIEKDVKLSYNINMESVVLELISIDDIEILNLTEYKNLSTENKRQLIQDSQNGICKGEFFRFYLIKSEKEIVGVLNLCGHGTDKISVAPEIFEKFRNNGFATKSLNLAYTIAKEMGFDTVIAGIRMENIASQKLHEKLGFSFVEDFISKSGKPMKRYIKKI